MCGMEKFSPTSFHTILTVFNRMGYWFESEVSSVRQPNRKYQDGEMQEGYWG